MLNPRLASRYAKSLFEIAVENNKLEEVKTEVEFILGIIKTSPEFKSLLLSPIIKPDKKQAIFREIGKDRFDPIIAGFIRLLIAKGRESVLPEILGTFKDIYNELKGIHKVKFVTAQPISDELRSSLLEKFRLDADIEHIELATEVRKEIIGGFILEYDNKLVDASIQRELRAIKRQFQSNEYMYRIR